MKLLLSYLLSGRAWKRLFTLSPGAIFYVAKTALGNSFFVQKPFTIEKAVGGDVEKFLQNVKVRKTPAIFEDFITREFHRLDDEGKRKVIEKADDLGNHTFDLLGSGPVNLGSDINWHQDFKSGKVWPNVRISRITYDFSGGFDIKVPWELSRFQYVSTLGYAYRITGDKKYPQIFVNLVNDWIQKNKVARGVNWKTAMDSAIRACNFIAGWYFFRQSLAWSDDFSRIFFASLADHGRFIIENLEVGGVKSNHYLSDITGLLFLGVLFPELKGAEKWKEKGLKSLEEEMRTQVYEDGVDFEASIPYHRLAAELFGFSALLCKTNGIELSEYFLHKLAKMFEFTKQYTKPNGLAPQIGDNDDGRLFIFEGDYVSWDRRDHRHLLRLYEELYGKKLIYWGSTPIESKLSGPDPDRGNRSLGFSEAGIYIMRSEKLYCIVDCGSNGQGGNGGHAHNDTLSFELHAAGRDFIVDPGSYIYTADPKERNRFRSTQMHNTVMTDGEEMNHLSAKTLFALANDAVPKINKWISDPRHDYLDAEHSGYKRLSNPITHRRVFSFNKIEEIVEISDFFHNPLGRGERPQPSHLLEWNFHLDPAVIVVERSFSLIPSQTP